MNKQQAIPAGRPKKARNYSTPALEKGLDVLELLAHESEGLTKSQVARMLNRTVSEMFRMLHCLEQRGYITQVDQDRYSLTLKLFKLAQEHPPTERLIIDALPVMHQFADATLQSCHIGVLEGDQVVVVAQVNAPSSLGFYVKLGSATDMMEAASGYVVLAHQDVEQRARMLDEWSKKTGKKPPRDLELHLDRIRKIGYEKRASYQVKGVLNISFPILGDRGSALAALTVPFIQHSGSSERSSSNVIDALRKAAAAVTHAIGGTSVQH